MMKESLAWNLTDRKFCLWDWNLETGTVGLSNNWIELLGYEFYEFMPSSEWFSALIHPEDKFKVICHLENHLIGDTTNEEFSFRLKRKDDSYLVFQSKGMIVLQDPAGLPGHVIWGSQLIEPKRLRYPKVAG